MKKLSMLLATLTLASAPAWAADYKCNGNRVEKGGSTRYTVRTSGPDITIEKGGGTRGKAVKRGNDYAVEVGGSTQATIEKGRIYKGGSTWKLGERGPARLRLPGHRRRHPLGARAEGAALVRHRPAVGVTAGHCFHALRRRRKRRKGLWSGPAASCGTCWK
ncbi:hypothetical protein ACN28I_27880 [Archangium gephyra]|uniref:hypothetical protein n=1 Tax=Archangium gephyra TaxID=48 RepID=UPI003B7B2DA2